MKSQHFTFHASNHLTIFLMFAHAVAMICIARVSLPTWAFISMLLTLVLSMVYFIMRYARLMLADAWVGLSFENSTTTLLSRSGETLPIKLLSGSVVTPYGVLLKVLAVERQHKDSVVVMADSMDAESFRQLRVLLKWRVATPV